MKIMAPQRTKIEFLSRIPHEILLEIYQQLDLESIANLCLTTRTQYEFFRSRTATIILSVLQRDFNPFDELLQIYTASRTDEDIACSSYVPRRVVFRRFDGDQGIVLSQDSIAPCLSRCKPFVKITSRVQGASSAKLFKTVVLTSSDLLPLIRHCRLVEKWEAIFPQMRWHHLPEKCRFLRAHERVRFRRALFRWWLYGVYFHGDLPRPRAGLPEPQVEDVRTSFLRYYSTEELLELMDFLETVKDIILYYICPRLDPDHGQPFEEHVSATRMGRMSSLVRSWCDQSVWNRIVKTYAKLGPEKLLYYLDNIHSYPKARLVREIRLQHASFTSDQESIQTAIRCVLDERRWGEKMPSLADESGGGIIDFDDERDEHRLLFSNDASPDGSLPPGVDFLGSISRYSPRGDDGSNLLEREVDF